MGVTSLPKPIDPKGLPGLLRKKALSLSPKGSKLSERDLDCLVQILVMASFTTGEEDVKSMIRPLSDKTLSYLFKLSQKSGPLTQFKCLFSIERHWRDGNLEKDWRWEWETKADGKLRYLAKSNVCIIH
jgi:hypothetical protein